MVKKMDSTLPEERFGCRICWIIMISNECFTQLKIRQNLKIVRLKVRDPYNLLLRPTNKLQPGKISIQLSRSVFFPKLRADPFLLFIKFSDFSGRFSSHQQDFLSVENEDVFLLFPCFWWKDERSTNFPKVGIWYCWWFRNPEISSWGW